ncbi:hypothetical protein CVT26_013960 [Gymnopilus dilepis]|uniref:Uncharacterized protein n=1 Tax=Gymnopilus dilepis TaxID=231916 RepID=A0A409WDS7_9AGAR|nr:hypothetical protein CVT26_013960 [Gymnopilus dilepis]
MNDEGRAGEEAKKGRKACFEGERRREEGGSAQLSSAPQAPCGLSQDCASQRRGKKEARRGTASSAISMPARKY